MNFLAPLFLAGAAAIALPILFHLIRRTTRDRLAFSSLRFLKPSPPRLSRRSRLEDLLLLLLRCAALALLAAGFARPFLRHDSSQETPPSTTRRTAILIDVSASMRRAGLWDQARARAAAVLDKAGPGDECALLTFDRQTRPVFDFEEWLRSPASDRSALAKARLDTQSPTWSATHVGDALIAAAEALQDQGDKPFSGRKEIVLISDLQEGGRLDRVQGFDWPKDVALRVEPIRATSAGNAGIQVVFDPNGTVASTGSVVRIRVVNSPDSKKEQFTVAWAQPGSDAPLGTPQELYVPPGQSRTLSLPTPASGNPDRILLRGDDEPFDNTVYVFPPEPVRLAIVYAGTDTRDDARQPLYFLRRGLPTTPGLAVDFSVVSPSESPRPGLLEGASLIVATSALEGRATDAILAAVRDGKTLLFSPGRAEDVASLVQWTGASRIPATEVKPPTYAMLGDIDFRHPLLAPFADPRFSDFTRIHFWRYRRIDPKSLPDARVIARFDNGDAAWLDVPVGKGRIVVLASGWHPDDSQFALSTKFVPFLFSLLESAGSGLKPASSAQWVDAPIALPDAAGTSFSMRIPGTGNPVPLPVGATRFTETRAPGVYELTSGTVTRKFAINLEPSESLTAPRNLDDLERVGAPVADLAAKPAVSPQRASQLAAAEAENRQKLWRWFLVATLFVLLVETAVAGWSLRRGMPAGEAVS